MGLKLVIERECSRDHQTALRQFLCCEPGGPEWAMDPQRYIRDLSVRKTPKGIMRTLLVVSGDIPLHDDVVGFCEYGVAVETTDEHEGVYQSDIEDWLTANTVETEDSKEMKKASAATDAEIK